MQRRLDGIFESREYPPGRVPARHRRRWLAGLGLLIVLVTMVVWTAQPVVAALPFSSWSERLVASRFLRPGRYFIVFQNPRELRPTGGFLGSFAVVNFGWGLRIKSLDVDTNIFKRDTRYKAELGVQAPAAIDEFTSGQPWALHNSNWALNYPEAAETMAWFYAHEGGTAVDGVIALDARILERILRLVGPLDFPEHDLYLTADNVIDTIQEEVEKNYWVREGASEENEPKSVLANLLPIVIERLRAAPLPDVIALATNALDAREIQAFVRDPALAGLLSAKQWDGHLRAGETVDFLHVNEANLSGVDTRAKLIGAKSSFSLERTNRLVRRADGTHQLTLIRAHHGQLVWPDGPNSSYLRIAVPRGSRLISATHNGERFDSDVRLDEEAGLTTFGFWSRLAPGATDTFEIVYSAPTVGLGSLLWQRQAGLPAPRVEIWDDGRLRFAGLAIDDLELF